MISMISVLCAPDKCPGELGKEHRVTNKKGNVYRVSKRGEGSVLAHVSNQGERQNLTLSKFCVTVMVT